MIKITDVKERNGTIISMGEMKPLQIGKVIGGECSEHIVMRTASSDKFEIMDLSDPGQDSCWTERHELFKPKVELLSPNQIITLQISNG